MGYYQFLKGNTIEVTKIRVVIKLTVVSNEKLMKDDRKHIVANMKYDFEFAGPFLPQNFVNISNTKITETLKPD